MISAVQVRQRTIGYADLGRSVTWAPSTSRSAATPVAPLRSSWQKIFDESGSGSVAKASTSSRTSSTAPRPPRVSTRSRWCHTRWPAPPTTRLDTAKLVKALLQLHHQRRRPAGCGLERRVGSDPGIPQVKQIPLPPWRRSRPAELKQAGSENPAAEAQAAAGDRSQLTSVFSGRRFH